MTRALKPYGRDNTRRDAVHNKMVLQHIGDGYIGRKVHMISPLFLLVSFNPCVSSNMGSIRIRLIPINLIYRNYSNFLIVMAKYITLRIARPPNSTKVKAVVIARITFEEYILGDRKRHA